MMPFIMGDPSTLPVELHGYLPLITSCDSITPGKVAYLTVTYYKLSDGFYGLKGAIDQEGPMKDDPKITRAMMALRVALKNLTQAMDPYAWD